MSDARDLGVLLILRQPSIYLAKPQCQKKCPSNGQGEVNLKYRVSHLVADLGWIDLDLGSSLGWWAATAATYCPGRVVEHHKCKSTQPRPDETPCTSESMGHTRPKHRERLPRRGAFPTGMGNERDAFSLPQDSGPSKMDKMSQAVTTPENIPSWPGTALASSTANECHEDIRKKSVHFVQVNEVVLPKFT